ncbi:rhodopsin-like [Dreissena polymorpha]|uniref:rhodopsin-like n=1 Tax=Dreissena polymorpha TaxID=45954 RepID=UPI00226451F3|nr:rhodopsin-like [Dreissena polymorpha]
MYFRFRSLRTYSNLFVLNLAVSDLLMAVGNIPMLIISSFSGHWVFGVAGCYVYAFLGAVGSFVSINTLAVISVDRCFVILKTIPGQKRMSRRTFATIITTIWLYAIAWASGPFFGFGRYILEGTNTSCTFDFFSKTPAVQGFVIAIFIVHFCIPVTVISVSYFLLYTAIMRFKLQFLEASRVFGEIELPLPMRRGSQGYINEKKTTRAVIIVILVFCISWAPYACVAMFGVFGDASKITRLAAGIPGLFAKCSAIFNPIIYALLHPRFRSKLFPCRRGETERGTALNRTPLFNL